MAWPATSAIVSGIALIIRTRMLVSRSFLCGLLGDWMWDDEGGRDEK